MHYRLHEANPYTCYGRLSDQIVVDAYSMIEGSRMKFIGDHQRDLRCESVQGIVDAIDRGLISADSVGGRVIVLASFTGGRRYHVMNYQDAIRWLYLECLALLTYLSLSHATPSGGK
jgi:hypothetical protein